jgi:hypothetical protein
VDENRRFLLKVITAGLEFDLIRCEDFFERLPVDVLAHHLPVESKARLLAACLQADTVDEELILDTLGIEIVSAYAPAAFLWNIIEDCALRALEENASTADAPATRERLRADIGHPAGTGKFEGSAQAEQFTAKTAVASSSRLEQLARQDDTDWDGEETKPGA